MIWPGTLVKQLRRGPMNTNRIRRSTGHWAGLVLLSLIVTTASCRPSASKEEKNSPSKTPIQPTVSVGVVRAQLMENVVKMPATVESDETALLMSRVEAYVREVLVDIGDEVEAGQVLIRLHAPEIEQKAQQQVAMIDQLRAERSVMQAELAVARSQLDEIRAQLELKRSERDRLERLANSGAIERQRLEEAVSAARATEAMLARYENSARVVLARLARNESEESVAQTELNQAETLAGYLDIRAPFAGVVAKRNVDPGNLVLPVSSEKGDIPLMVVAKIDKLRAVVYATLDIAGQLSLGSPVTFVADDLPDVQFPCQISRIAGAYDEGTRMMRAEIDLENPPDVATGRRPLRAGSYGMATIVLQSATLPVVPPSALRQGGDGTSVVVVRNGTCLITPVKVALESSGLAGIAAGIEAGDQVVIENPDSLVQNQQLQASQIKLVPW